MITVSTRLLLPRKPNIVSNRNLFHMITNIYYFPAAMMAKRHILAFVDLGGAADSPMGDFH